MYLNKCKRKYKMNYQFSFRGRPIIAMAISQEEIQTLTGDAGCMGLFKTPDEPLLGEWSKFNGYAFIMLDKDRLSVPLIRHEVMHMALWSNMIKTADTLDVHALEEIMCETFAWFGDGLVELSDLIYKELTKKPKTRKRRK